MYSYMNNVNNVKQVHTKETIVHTHTQAAQPAVLAMQRHALMQCHSWRQSYALAPIDSKNGVCHLTY